MMPPGGGWTIRVRRVRVLSVWAWRAVSDDGATVRGVATTPQRALVRALRSVAAAEGYVGRAYEAEAARRLAALVCQEDARRGTRAHALTEAEAALRAVPRSPGAAADALATTRDVLPHLYPASRAARLAIRDDIDRLVRRLAWTDPGDPDYQDLVDAARARLDQMHAAIRDALAAEVSR